MRSRLIRILALIAVLVAAALRLYGVSAASFELEEVAAMDAAERMLGVRDGTAPTDDAASRRMMPWPLLVEAAALHAGYDEFTQRLPGILAGIITVALVGSLAASVGGQEAALFAALGLACSPLHVAVSRTVGADVWLVLFGTLSALVFHRARSAAAGSREWVLFASVAALACGSGYGAVLLMIAVAVYVVSTPRPLGGPVAGRALTAIAGAVTVAAVCFLLDLGIQDPSLFPLRFGSQVAVEIASTLASGAGGAAAGGFLLLLCAVVGAVTAHRRGAGFYTLWFAAVVVGVVLTDWYRGLALQRGQLSVALPAYFVLVGTGMSWLRQATARVGTGRSGVVAGCGLLLFLLAIEVPPLWADLRQPPSWREAAAVVAANARSNDAIVVLNERSRFVFYAPDLERRVAQVTRPGLAPTLFVHPERGWLIAPAKSRLYPGWQRVASWFARFPPLNLSPGPGVDVYYLGRGGRDQFLIEAASFELPTAVLVRGTLLLDMLKQNGPTAPVLWKVDQIALSREQLDFHNPQLLSVVSLLAQRGFGDRAASLAYRLASADPAWKEAREALAALGKTGQR